jgi:predicted DNA-binding transcriptional regulator YafY
MSSSTRGPDVVRMLTLVPWLLQRPGASIEEVANAFAVDRSTLRRELEHLDFCGLPGLGGGALFDVSLAGEQIFVRMADELRRPLRPTPVEALRLLLMARAVERAVGDDVPALSSAIEKLHVAFGIAVGSVEILDSGAGDDVMEARRAIAADRSLRFEYRGRGDVGPQARHVDPWALDLIEGAWYLHAFDHDAGAARIFRLERAARLVTSDEPRRTVPDAALPLPRYEAAPDDAEVVLRLEQGAVWLLDALSVDATLEEGSLTIARLRTGDPEWLVRLVLMAGGAAQVVQPAALRALVRQRALDALGLLEAVRGGSDGASSIAR